MSQIIAAYVTSSRKGVLALLVILLAFGSWDIERASRGRLAVVEDVVLKKGNPSSDQTINAPTPTLRTSSGPGARASTLHPYMHSPLKQTSYPIGAEYLFWSGQNQICSLIGNITGVSKIGLNNPPSYLEVGSPPPLVNLTINCTVMSENTGNWVTALYHLRLAAAVGRVDFQFQCDDGMDTAESSILPWLSGYFPSTCYSTSTSEWKCDLGWPDEDLVCSNKYSKLPLQHVAHEMQKDMRSLAVAILGPRNFNTSGLESRLDFLRSEIRRRHPAGSIYPRDGIAVDDAAIHFRCGDVFGGTQKDVYGFIKFREFKDLIPRETTRSIGIFTQPFDESRVRQDDREFVKNCEKIVGVLVDYLYKSYPNATISIRNKQEDTIPLTYARMVMASQTMTTMSTFGIFPAIGTFGDGFFKASGRQNRFARDVPQILPNFHVMASGNILSSPEIRKSGWNDVVKFLTED